MKTLALALASTLALAAVLSAPAVSAEERPAPAAERTASAEAPLGRDGQDTRQFCSNQNPNIVYRDCVNASTRDPNAKVRLG